MTNKMSEVGKKYFEKMQKKAQNLVDALENQNPIDKEDCRSEVETKDIYWIDEHGNRKKVHDPYGILKKEEKPKSIWKSVDELPNRPADIILTTNTQKDFYLLGHFTPPTDKISREYILLISGGGDMEIPIDMVHKYCELTDFINHIESLEERINKLEEK